MSVKKGSALKVTAQGVVAWLLGVAWLVVRAVILMVLLRLFHDWWWPALPVWGFLQSLALIILVAVTIG